MIYFHVPSADRPFQKNSRQQTEQRSPVNSSNPISSDIVPFSESFSFTAEYKTKMKFNRAFANIDL